MGIHSINGQGSSVLAPANAARAPAPKLRAREEVSETALPLRQVQETNKEQAKQTAKSVEQETPGLNPNLPRFSIRADTKQIVAQIVDEHNKVVRQIPPEELLRAAARMRKLEGMLFDRST